MLFGLVTGSSSSFLLIGHVFHFLHTCVSLFFGLVFNAAAGVECHEVHEDVVTLLFLRIKIDHYIFVRLIFLLSCRCGDLFLQWLSLLDSGFIDALKVLDKLLAHLVLLHLVVHGLAALNLDTAGW